MHEFKDELKELAINYKKDIDASESDTEYGLDNARNLTPVLKIVYEKFEQSIDSFNKEFGSQLLFIEQLSVEIFRLLLNFDDINSCFVLRSQYKLAFIFNEGTDQIAFFGKNKPSIKQKSSQGFIQLFKLRVISVNNAIEFKDNTGRKIDIEEVIIQVIRWLVS
jgi:hypothetical protein